ncbi:MAG TPA: DUF1570 domain-containing protein [Planctomycetota bacterium]|nr:DUF1570 domain-containing protein [Planctomycetota bacterium]
MRKAVGLLVLATLARGGGDPEAFAKGLAGIRDLLADGKCARAQKVLDDLLQEHAKAPYAVGRRVEIEEMAKQIVFGTTVEPPDPKKLVSGNLEQYDARTGTLRIRYTPSTMKDWTLVKHLWVHPATFNGSHSITIKGEENASSGMILVCLNNQEGMIAHLCRGAEERASISRIYPEGMAMLASAPSTFAEGASYTAKVSVNRTSVQLLSGGRALVRAPKKADEWGMLAVSAFKFEEILIAGKAEPSWIQGLVDAERQRLLAEFGKRWDPKGHLPPWLYGAPAAAPALALARPDAREWPVLLDAEAGAIVDRVVALSGKGEAAAALRLLAESRTEAIPAASLHYLRGLLLEQLGHHEEAIAACRAVREAEPDFAPVVPIEASALFALGRAEEAIVLYRALLGRFPGSPELHAQAALFLGAAGKWDEAEMMLRGAARAGVTSDELDVVGRQVHKALHGPAWQRRHDYQTSHYLVLSDMDPKVCFEASQILEQAYAVFVSRLERAPSTTERFRVFLFSGQAGYQDHVKDLFGSTAPHTAGLYAPPLRQLFIWNLPEREDMMRTVRHEGFHQYLHRIMDDPPLWFNEGLAEYFEEARVVRGVWTTGDPRHDHLALLVAPQPLKDFLFLDRGAFMRRAFVNYAQAWAFIHFLLHSTRENRQLFDRFWDSFKRIPSNADAIRDALGDRPIDSVDGEFRVHVEALRRLR